jgi:enoyl-CoA hydratase/carnithine racemase
MAKSRVRAAQSDSAAEVAVARAGAVIILTLSRPERANALTVRTIERLLEALDAAEADPMARAIVLRGAGRNFCAGADLAELLEGGAPAVRTLMDSLRTFLLRIEGSRLAVVAAVQGAARAGGVEILLACDLVVAAETATFGDAHLANGLLPAGGASVRLPRTIGWQRAKWLLLTAATISAQTAEAWGLVMEVCAEGDLDAAAERLAESLSRADPDTFARAKGLLSDLPDLSFEKALEAEIKTLEAHALTPAFRDGVSSFLTRKPQLISPCPST